MSEPESTDDESNEGGELQRQTSSGMAARAGLAVVRFYQNAISPLFPPSCRFQPSCSEYTKRAIEKHGLLKGGWLGAKRILKCHPFHPGGHDPVP
jgi:hypothetical protein